VDGDDEEMLNICLYNSYKYDDDNDNAFTITIQMYTLNQSGQ